MTPKHGDRVRWRRRMMRRHHPTNYAKKHWEPTPWDAPGEGIFLGWRTKQNGKVVWDQECGNYFERDREDSSVRTAYVSQGPTSNPIYVDPEGLEVMSHDVT